MRGTTVRALALAAAVAAQPGVPSNPFCAVQTPAYGAAVTLSCVSGVIDGISFAAFGAPSGSCPAFRPGACDDPTFPSYVNATCLGQRSCVLIRSANPCPNEETMAVVAHCSDTSGGFSPPSPTCALNGLPCPAPRWEPSWNLTQSTVIQPSSPGFFVPSHPWGLVSLDWSVASSIWWTGSPATATCEATSIRGCAALKAAGLAHRCYIYHSTELALEWLESQRPLFNDSSKANWFLRFPNGTVLDSPTGYGRQFYWNMSVPEAASHFVASVLGTIASEPAVDGTLLDEVPGPGSEAPGLMATLQLSGAQLAALQFASQTAVQTLIQDAVLAGKFVWQGFGAGDAVGPGISQGSCAAFMRARCTPGWQAAPMTMLMDPTAAEQSVAAFLVIRSPHAFIGYGWESDDRDWDPHFLLQAGEPAGLCAEGPAGVFSRPWTGGVASLDCNTWTASLPFPSL